MHYHVLLLTVLAFRLQYGFSIYWPWSASSQLARPARALRACYLPGAMSGFAGRCCYLRCLVVTLVSHLKCSYLPMNHSLWTAWRVHCCAVRFVGHWTLSPVPLCALSWFPFFSYSGHLVVQPPARVGETYLVVPAGL